MQRGKPINVWYQLPVTFRIDDKKTEEQNDENPIFVKVEQMPQYEGGTKALLKFLALLSKKMERLERLLY